jgi:hypothetical protein
MLNFSFWPELALSEEGPNALDQLYRITWKGRVKGSGLFSYFCIMGLIFCLPGNTITT